METNNEPSRKRSRGIPGPAGPAKIVKLQVGDRRELVARKTLTRFGDSTLARMFGEDWAGSHFTETDDGYIFLDRDSEIFRGVLRFLRTGIVHFDPRDRRFNESLRDELDFWGLPWQVEEKKKGFDCAVQAETDYHSGGGSTLDAPLVIGCLEIESNGFAEDVQLAKTIMQATASVAQDVSIWPRSIYQNGTYAKKQLAEIGHALVRLLPDSYAWIVTVGNLQSETPLIWSTADLAPTRFTANRNGEEKIRFCVIAIEK